VPNRKEKEETKKIKPITLSILLVTALLTTTLMTFPTTSAAATTLPYTETNGVLNGANYTIRIPNPMENWNGMLVMLCRGYTPAADITTGASAAVPPALQPTGGFTSVTPLLIAEGYAIAASNYGAVGMSIQKGISSTYELTQYVINNFNVKGKVFLIGQSMGGAIALLLGQKYPNVYSGVLDEAGIKDLAEIYTGAVAMAATQNDSALIAMLQAMPAAVIPYPLSALVPSSLPLSVRLQVWRSFCLQASVDEVAETGGTPTTVPQAYAMDSPILNANISIPVITVHGTRDGLVGYSQSLGYQIAVAAAGKSSLYRLYTVPGAEHVDTQILGQTMERLTELVGWSNALDGWTMTVDGRSLKAYPDLKETIWATNATMPPNGPYDKIGLHRLVKTGITPKGAVFLTNCPMWGTGEIRISNPASDSWTKYENASQAIYWANRGFDVYAIDYRTHFVPKTLNASQLSVMANWGLDVWVSDIKEAAEKVKQVSGSQKFFISGECSGGMAALNYATKYWKTDLKGIILLDANFFTVNYPIVGRMTETNTFNLTSAVNAVAASSN
jgi:pimeloyl-ACP methyl ester carboxylesterase